MTPRSALLLPVALALALTLPGIAREGYTHEDEWRNAVMVREMAASGPVAHPRLHGELYPDYPPLYFWAALPVVEAQGAVTPLAVRLPSALGAVLVAFGTALLGLRLGSPRTALTAGLLVSVLPGLHMEERRAMIDPLFTGLATLAVALLVKGTRRTMPWGCLALALTWLTKGPLGAVLIGLALAGGEGLLAVLDARERRWKDIFGRAGILLAFVVVVGGLWFAYAYRAQGEAFGDNLLWQQTVGRFKDRNNPQHEKPWHFYLATALPLLLPQLAFGLVGARRERLSLFALGWFALTLLFLSACNTKRTYYPMPAFPAVSLLAAGFFERARPASLDAVWQSAVSWALVFTQIVGVLVGVFYARDLLALGLTVSLGAGLGYGSFRLLLARRKPALAVVAASAFVLAAVSASVTPAIARRKGQKDLAEKLAGVKHVAVSPGGIHREALCFWLSRGGAASGTPNVESRTNGADAAGVVRWLEQFPSGEAVVIIHRRDLEGALNPLAPGSKLLLVAASDEEASSDDFVALGRRP